MKGKKNPAQNPGKKANRKKSPPRGPEKKAVGKKIPLKALLPALLFFLLLFAFYASFQWHSFALKEESVSYSLLSYDRLFAEGGDACFSLEVKASNAMEKRTEAMVVKAGEKTLLAENIEIRDSVQEYCFSTAGLPEESLVELSIGGETLFYGLGKTGRIAAGSPKLSFPEPAVEKIPGGAIVSFSVEDFPAHKIAPAGIFVNGELEHRVFPEREKQEFSERIELREGKNTIRIECLGSSSETGAESTRPFTLPLAAGLLLIAIAFFVFHAFVFGQRPLVEGAALSLASVIALFILNAFLLNAAVMLSTYSFVLLLLAELLALAFVFRGGFSLGGLSLKEINPGILGLIVVLFFVVVTLFLPLVSPSHQTAWSVYYERQANAVAEGFAVPGTDELSYLGRNFTFTPGYFLFEGALYWLTGSLQEQMFALTIAFSNLFFALSALFLAGRLGLGRKASALFIVFLSMGTFAFTTFTLTPRHGIALSLLFVALALALGKRKWWNSSVFLGFALFIQLPAAVFFLLLCPMLAKRVDWKRVGKIFLGGFALFLPLYAFIPLANGLPIQILPKTWGYLISLPFYSLFENPGILFIFFSFFMLFELLQHYSGKSIWDRYRKKLFYGVVLSLALQLLVSSRLDLVSGVLVAAFLAYSMEKYKKDLTPFASYLFGLVLLFGLFLAVSEMYNYTHSQPLQDALAALGKNSSSSDRVLSDPYFSHQIAFKSRRITLADLMVEYADPEKFHDSYRFLKEKDYSVLEKYGTGLVFAEKHFVHSSVTASERTLEPIEFREMDKFYANSKISIHRKR